MKSPEDYGYKNAQEMHERILMVEKERNGLQTAISNSDMSVCDSCHKVYENFYIDFLDNDEKVCENCSEEGAKL